MKRDQLPLPGEGRAWREMGRGRSRWKLLVGGLALIATVLLSRRAIAERSKIDRTEQRIGEVRRALGLFKDALGRCPQSTLELLHPPNGANYLNDAPRDAWGKELWVQCPGYFEGVEFDVVSAGPSGDFFRQDNIL